MIPDATESNPSRRPLSADHRLPSPKTARRLRPLSR
jgi:hypothetical protein